MTLVEGKLKTLEELENDIWPEPSFNSHLVITCHELRKKPIDQFTVENLRMMIGQNNSLDYLVPVALTKLEVNPLAEGNHYEGDLLVSVTKVNADYFNQYPEQVQRVISIIEDALPTIDIDDSELTRDCNGFLEKWIH